MKKLVVEVILKALEKKDLKLKAAYIENYIEIPPSVEMGDYAFPCFILSPQLKQSPEQIALELREHMGDASKKDFDEIQTSGPYINFFLNRKSFVLNTVKEVLSQKHKYGKSDVNKNKRVMIEFSQANTHKAFHVGHIRGTSLGESLARIFEFCGSKVIRANYQGDTGMHVAKWLWCYEKYHKREKLKKDEAWIASIYVDAVKRLGTHKTLQKQVDEINQKLIYHEDRHLNALWKQTRKDSLDALEKIYKDLNTRFDVYFFESEFDKPALKIVDELIEKKIARVSDGAVIINLKKYNLGVWVLLRKDKTVLYSTKDILLALKKFNKYKLDKSLYVVGAAQSLHMQQLFKTLHLMKIKETDNCDFVPFSEVRLPGKKMSSRTGDNVLYSDFIRETIDFTKKRLKQKDKKISKNQIDDRALKISIAAVKYSMLKQGPNKNIIFKKQDALNFEGDTGPYLLYSYVRANSILKKFNRMKNKKQAELGELESIEFALAKKISNFPDIVLMAYNTKNPSLIANYSYQLAQIFNEFYHACPVIKSEKETFRISLVGAFKQVLQNSLTLLGIETLEAM